MDADVIAVVRYGEGIADEEEEPEKEDSLLGTGVGDN